MAFKVAVSLTYLASDDDSKKSGWWIGKDVEGSSRSL